MTELMYAIERKGHDLMINDKPQKIIKRGIRRS